MTSKNWIKYDFPDPSELWSEYGGSVNKFKTMTMAQIYALPEMKSYERLADEFGLPVVFKNKDRIWAQLRLHVKGRLKMPIPKKPIVAGTKRTIGTATNLEREEDCDSESLDDWDCECPFCKAEKARFLEILWQPE